MLNGVHILEQFGPSREVKIVTQLITSLLRERVWLRYSFSWAYARGQQNYCSAQ